MHSSIIIISYNGRKYLQACIASVLQETAQDDEVILVDNASTDGSAEVVEARYPQVRVWHNRVNVGFAAACNQGVEMANGEVLVFLNQDTCVQPGWMEGLLAPLEVSTVGLVTSKLLLLEQPGLIQMCGQDVHYSGFTFGRGYLSPAKGYAKEEQVAAVSGASFAIRRSLWKELGGFDPQLFMYYEETDLSWRARLAGFKSLYSPNSVVLHDYTPGDSELAHTYSERNRWVLLLKNWKWVTLFLLLPCLALAEMIDWGYMALVGRKGLWAKAKSVGWLVRNMPGILRERSKAQALRQESDWVVLKACTPKLHPRHHTGGRMGKIIIGVSNGVFQVHYWMVMGITRALKI